MAKCLVSERKNNNLANKELAASGVPPAWVQWMGTLTRSVTDNLAAQYVGLEVVTSPPPHLSQSDQSFSGTDFRTLHSD